MKRHPMDPVSLAGGLFFVALGIAFYAGGVDLANDGFRWIWPAAFVGLALVVLFTVRPARGASETEPSREAPTATTAPGPTSQGEEAAPAPTSPEQETHEDPL
jgi:hypothetical protein